MVFSFNQLSSGGWLIHRSGDRVLRVPYSGSADCHLGNSDSMPQGRSSRKPASTDKELPDPDGEEITEGLASLAIGAVHRFGIGKPVTACLSMILSMDQQRSTQMIARLELMRIMDIHIMNYVRFNLRNWFTLPLAATASSTLVPRLEVESLSSGL